MLCRERHVAEQVDGMVVAEEPEGSRLGDVGVLQGVTADVAGVGAAYELVAETDLEEDTVVHRKDKLIGCVPIEIVNVKEAAIVPAASRHIRGEFLHIEKRSHVLAIAAVHTFDVRIAARAGGCGAGKSLIALGEKGCESLLAVEHVLRKLDVRIDRLHVKVTDTGRGRGGEHCRGEGDRCKSDNIFHCLCRIRS